jgi:hypothetical protein
VGPRVGARGHGPGVTSVTGGNPAATIATMSEHTERLSQLSERMSAAKEFL